MLNTLNIPRWVILHHLNGSIIDSEADTFHHTAETINVWHQRRWDCKSQLDWYVSYHYVIEYSGKLVQTRNDWERGLHCKGMNTSSIGIALAGNFNRSKYKDHSLPSKEQEETLRGLLLELTDQYNIPLNHIVPHRYFASYKKCFGSNLPDNWGQNLIREDIRIELLRKQIKIIEKLLTYFVRLLNSIKKEEVK